MNQNEQNTPSGKSYELVLSDETPPLRDGWYHVIRRSGHPASDYFYLDTGWSGGTVLYWLREVEAPLSAPVPSGELIERMRAVIETAWEDYASDQTFIEQAAKACAQIALNISPENVQP